MAWWAWLLIGGFVGGLIGAGVVLVQFAKGFRW